MTILLFTLDDLISPLDTFKEETLRNGRASLLDKQIETKVNSEVDAEAVAAALEKELNRGKVDKVASALHKNRQREVLLNDFDVDLIVHVVRWWKTKTSYLKSLHGLLDEMISHMVDRPIDEEGYSHFCMDVSDVFLVRSILIDFKNLSDGLDEMISNGCERLINKLSQNL